MQILLPMYFFLLFHRRANGGKFMHSFFNVNLLRLQMNGKNLFPLFLGYRNVCNWSWAEVWENTSNNKTLSKATEKHFLLKIIKKFMYTIFSNLLMYIKKFSVLSYLAWWLVKFDGILMRSMNIKQVALEKAAVESERSFSLHARMKMYSNRTEQSETLVEQNLRTKIGIN